MVKLDIVIIHMVGFPKFSHIYTFIEFTDITSTCYITLKGKQDDLM